jgi:PAS domain S-box-containing protein
VDLAASARLRGLLELSRLLGSPDVSPSLPEAIAAAVSEASGFRTVAVNLFRAAWDDFEVAAVHGNPSARKALLGRTVEWQVWRPLLDGRFERNGAYLIPQGEHRWRDGDPRFVPDLPAAADSGAWHPEDVLLAPMHHSDGHLLGVLSLDEPESGRRPFDEELEVLSVAAALAARAVESAQASAEAERDRRTLEQLLQVSSRLSESHSVDDILQSVCDAIGSALDFELVAVALADEAADRYRPRAAAGIELARADVQLDVSIARMRALFDPAFEIEGCYLLPREAALARVEAEPSSFESMKNGRGPRGWNRHWLLVPLYDRSAEPIGFIWADDPDDHLIPTCPRLQALRLFADQAATALAAAEQFEALREADETKRAIIAAAPFAVLSLDREGTVLSWNPAAERIFGWSAEEAIGRRLPYVAEHQWPEFESMLGRLREGESIVGHEVTRFRRGGAPVRISVSTAPIRGAHGQVTGVMAAVADITSHREAEEELARQNAELKALHETTFQLIERREPASLLEAIVARAGDLLGTRSGYVYLVDDERDVLVAAVTLGIFEGYGNVPLRRGEGLGGRVWAEQRAIAVDDYSEWPGRVSEYAEAGFRAIAAVPLRAGARVVGVLGIGLEGGERRFGEAELALLTRFGQLASLALENARLYEQAKRELEERREAEKALRQSQELYRSVVENSSDIIVLIGLDGTIRYGSPSHRTVLGYTDEELLGSDLLALVHPDDRDAVAALVAEAVASGRSGSYIGRARHKDGRWVEMEGTPTLIRNDHGEPDAVMGIIRDVSERLRAAEEKARLEEQLWQSQKIEAVGRLAGGIAHDFNNLLTAIAGYGEVAVAALPEGAPARESVEEIQRAAERAAVLTRQLLAFSRKQVLQPKTIDLNEVVSELEGMLARVLGEHVELVTALDPDLEPTRADPGQIGQVVMNLAINARDAMPQGGVLTIATANVELDELFVRRHVGARAGTYVMLAVSDSGTGMDRETLERVFEPFFTTKPQGQGTGLGLSTVYGIVKQTGGQIWARSEPGHGTTFEVYLPRTAESSPTVDEERPPSPPQRLPGNETVLLVEDEEIVRKLVREMLETAGYEVLQAADGAEAIALADRYEATIDLLMTDVVMPGLSGQELARRLAERRPGIRVLFTSGYTEDAIANHGVLSPGTAFLEKPFTAAVLGEKLRELLDTKLVA